MDIEKSSLREEILKGINTKRILRLPVAEKFLLVEYIKLLAQEASFAEANGIHRLREAPNFEKDHTYRLLAPLLVHDVSFDDIKRIVLNYLYKFERSDIYYAKFAILGMGVLLIKRGVDGSTVFHVLLSLLGIDFLTGNLRLAGYTQAFEKEVETESIIRYKEYDTFYRKTKYDLLALLLLHEEEGKDALDTYIVDHYQGEKLVLLYRILSELPTSVRLDTFNSLLRSGEDFEKMILAGIYSIIRKKSLMVSHYMMNSMIGKYSHFDQRSERVEAEAREILASMKAELGLK